MESLPLLGEGQDDGGVVRAVSFKVPLTPALSRRERGIRGNFYFVRAFLFIPAP